MQAPDHTATVQLISGLVAQLSKNEPLSGSFSRHATVALLTAQQSLRAAAAVPSQQTALQQPNSKLTDAFQKLLEALNKRLSKAQVC